MAPPRKFSVRVDPPWFRSGVPNPFQLLVHAATQFMDVNTSYTIACQGSIVSSIFVEVNEPVTCLECISARFRKKLVYVP